MSGAERSGRVILVTGATGRQGGATLRHLEGTGFALRALTRDPDKAGARALAARGVEVVRGDLDDRASLERATAGAWGVFSVQDPWLHGVAAEIRQGCTLADVAKAAGVGCFVYTSVGTAEQKTGVPHFESKGTIEAHVRGLGLPHSFVRPVFFMDVLLPRYDKNSARLWGALRRGLRSDGRFQVVSVDDIGRVAAECFLRPDELAGQAIELAADELTVPDAVRLYTAALGHAPKIREVPFWLMRLFNHEAALNFEWMAAKGWHYPLGPMRQRFPFLQTFETWLRTQPAERSS